MLLCWNINNIYSKLIYHSEIQVDFRARTETPGDPGSMWEESSAVH